MYTITLLQFEISSNAIEIRAVQSPQCIVGFAVTVDTFIRTFLQKICILTCKGRAKSDKPFFLR
jgi:hypothetical protein